MNANLDLVTVLVAYDQNLAFKMVAVEILLIRRAPNGRLHHSVAEARDEWKQAGYQVREMFAGAVRLGDPMPPAPKKLPSRQRCQQNRRAA